MNLRLQQILEERKNKLSIISPAIKDIHDRTVRAVKNKVAGEKEFVNKVGKYYPKGSLYHVHYTNDKRTYYMTGGEHTEKTKLLFRTNIFDYFFSSIFENVLCFNFTFKNNPIKFFKFSFTTFSLFFSCLNIFLDL